MAKKKNVRKNVKTGETKAEVKYAQITAEILFTDGEVKTATFYKLEDVLDYVNQCVKAQYVNSIRIELF